MSAEAGAEDGGGVFLTGAAGIGRKAEVAVEASHRFGKRATIDDATTGTVVVANTVAGATAFDPAATCGPVIAGGTGIAAHAGGHRRGCAEYQKASKSHRAEVDFRKVHVILPFKV